MPKRKRKELNDGLEAPEIIQKKKFTTETAIKPAKKTSAVTKSKPQATVVQVENISSKPTAVRIIVGSYEKVLCGVDARFDTQSTEKVTSFKVSSDGQNKLNLSPVYMFSAHTGAIKCLAANDRYLVSGGSDEIIKYAPTPLFSNNRIYDLKKRKDLGSLVQHNGAITALQFYSRTHLLSASEDGTICIWRTRDWECMATMKGHKGRVNGLCVHPTGKIAVSVGKDKALRLWNLMTGRKASANKLGEGISLTG